MPFRVAHTQGDEPFQRAEENFYYNSGARRNESNDPKNSMIIYRYKQGENLEIK